MKNKNIILTSPLAGGARRTGKSEGYQKGSFIVSPSSVCSDFVRQTTSPAKGGSQTTDGFTLIELLVVVLIIGILAAVALPQYQQAVLKSRVMQVVPIIQAVANAQEIYFLTNGFYSENPEELDIDFTCPNDWTCTMNRDGSTTGYPKIQAKHNNSNIYLIYYYGVPTDARLVAAGAQHKLYCSAATTNTQGVRVCKSFGPELLTSDGWRRYLVQ